MRTGGRCRKQDRPHGRCRGRATGFVLVAGKVVLPVRTGRTAGLRSAVLPLVEDEGKEQQDDKGVGGEDVPHRRPFAYLIELSADFLAVREEIGRASCRERV